MNINKLPVKLFYFLQEPVYEFGSKGELHLAKCIEKEARKRANGEEVEPCLYSELIQELSSEEQQEFARLANEKVKKIERIIKERRESVSQGEINRAARYEAEGAAQNRLIGQHNH